MSPSERITMTLPSRVEHLDVVQHVAEETARLAGFGRDDQTDIGLAVREGAINAMKHGHGFDPALAVTLEFRTAPESLKISIVDEGEGFDPDEAPDPCHPDNIWKSSGRGLLLIKSLVDEVDIRCNGSGVTLVLVKQRPADDAVPEAGAAP